MCDIVANAAISRRGMVATALAATGAVALGGAAPAAAVPNQGHGGGHGSRRTELVLLGTVGGPTWYGDDNGHGISSVVLVGDDAYVVDFGSGAYRQLRRAGVGPGQEKALFLTHLHSDHVIDLSSLLMFDPGARRRSGTQVHVLGPGQRESLPPLPPGSSAPPLENPENPCPGTVDLVDSLFAAHATDINTRLRAEGGADTRPHIVAADIALPAGVDVDPTRATAPPMEPFTVWEDENVRVSATLVPHGAVFPNYAYRIDTEEGSVAFSGDTAVSDNLVRLAQDVDILVHEVIDMDWVLDLVGPEPWNPTQEALYEHIVGGHTQISEVGPVAERANAATLVLSHLVPGGLPPGHWRRGVRGFSGRILVGRDLMRMRIGR